MLNIGILARRSEGKDPPGDRRLRGAGLPDTVPAMPPSLGAAVGLGLRALVRESWLLAVGVLVAIARRAAMWPAWAVAAAMLWGGAAEAIELGALDPGAPLRGALAVAGSPRFLVLVAGLWLTGTALGAVPGTRAAVASPEGSPTGCRPCSRPGCWPWRWTSPAVSLD
jgi:hypothetical protein